MTIDEAIKILDPATTAAELAKLETYGKLIGTQAAIKATEDACLIAVEIMERSMWIPCSERLPEEAGKYLVCVASEAFPGSMYIDILRYDQKGWKRDCVYAANVTHWQPLPEPPEEGDAGNAVD